MKIETILYETLTNSAKRELKDYTQDITNYIIYKAIENSFSESSKRSNYNISVEELQDAKNQIIVNGYTNYKKNNRTEKLLLLVLFVGVIYVCLGLVVYLYQCYSAELHQHMGLLITILGITVCVCAICGVFLLKLISKMRVAQESMQLSKFYFSEIIICKWKQIETLGMQIMLSLEPNKRKPNSVNDIIKFLSENLSIVSKDELKLLLAIRNSMVHQDKYMSSIEFQQVLKIADKIIYELKEKMTDKKDNS